jgi:hypothetical protein
MENTYLLLIFGFMMYGALAAVQEQPKVLLNTKNLGDGFYTIKDGNVIAFKDMKESSALSKNICKDVYNDLFVNPDYSPAKKAGYMIGDVGLAFGCLYTCEYMVHGNWAAAGISLLATALSAGLCVIGLQNESEIFRPLKAEITIKTALFFAAMGLTSRLNPGKN